MEKKKKKFLLFNRYWLGKEEEREVIDTLRSGWITKGPKTKKFEELFANYCKVKYAIGVNSCTAGLHLALISLGIGKDDEVITTPITFPATANTIIHTGATPVFVDVEPDTLNIATDKIEEAITEKTKAIMPVHFAGQPCKMNEIAKIARKYKLAVIEDAAHAIESVYKGKKIGSISDFTSFSFYATKNITTGEGGMLVTNNKNLAEKARILSLHGISKDAWKRYGNKGYAHWETFYPGYKYNMFDIQAALGIPQLKKIEKFWKRRKEIVKMYNDAFQNIEEILIIGKEIKNDCKSAYHLYPIIIRTEKLKTNRDIFMNTIQKEGIGLGVHFRALHLQEYFKQQGYHRGMFLNAEYASDRLISLPLYPRMKDSEVKKVIRVVKKTLNSFKK